MPELDGEQLEHYKRRVTVLLDRIDTRLIHALEELQAASGQPGAAADRVVRANAATVAAHDALRSLRDQSGL